MLVCLSHTSILSMSVGFSDHVTTADIQGSQNTDRSTLPAHLGRVSDQTSTRLVSGSAMPTAVEPQPGVVGQSRRRTFAAHESLCNVTSKDSQCRVLQASIVTVRIQRGRRYRYVTRVSLMRSEQMTIQIFAIGPLPSYITISGSMEETRKCGPAVPAKL